MIKLPLSSFSNILTTPEFILFHCNRYCLGTVTFSFVIKVEYSVNFKQPTSVCILIVTHVQRFVTFMFVIERFNCSRIFFVYFFSIRDQNDLLLQQTISIIQERREIHISQTFRGGAAMPHQRKVG